MNRPDEIAALADRLTFAAENTQGCLYSQRKMLNEAAAALRLSATSPGDAVREDQSKIGMLLLDYANGHACDDKEFARSAGSRLVNGAATAARSAADPLDDLVARFATALLAKLKDSREKYGYADEGWQYDDWRLSCREQLLKHLAKGDPRDVAAYCAFMWHHGWSTVSATPTPPSADVAKARVHADRIRWLLDNQPNALSFACEMHARARSIMESLDTLIQSAAPGGGHQSDGGDLSALPSGECEPVVTQAYPPSDPAQEPEAVALKPCPFCGSSDSFAERYDYSSTYVKCNNCSAHGPTELQEDDREETLGEEFAKRAWNTRPVSLDREAYAQGVRDANQLVGCLWVDLFNKDMVKAAGADFFDDWRGRILALTEGRT